MNRTIQLRFACSVALTATLALAIHAYGQLSGQPNRPQRPWSDAALSPDVRADLVIKELTLDEKIQLVHGLGWQAMFQAPASGQGTRAISAGGFIPGVPRLGIPDLQM